VGEERISIAGPALRTADAVEVDPHTAQSQGLIEAIGDLDDLRVGAWRRRSNELDPDLVRFPESSLLRALVTEEWGDVIEPAKHAGRAEIVLDHASHDTGGALWFEGDASTALVLELVHLLGHDIGGLPCRTCEKLRIFKGGCSYFYIAIAPSQIAESAFDVMPLVGIGGKDVLSSSLGLEAHVAGIVNHCILGRGGLQSELILFGENPALKLVRADDGSPEIVVVRGPCAERVATYKVDLAVLQAIHARVTYQTVDDQGTLSISRADDQIDARFECPPDAPLRWKLSLDEFLKKLNDFRSSGV